jgi:ElaA protein
MTEKKIASIIKSFDELTPHQLYDCLRLRSAIFVVEQNCIFLDMDNKDQECYHLMLYQDNVLVAYSRLVPPGLYYSEAAIGRVITSSTVRGKGMGRTLMERSIKSVYDLFGKQDIRIGAQVYAQKFYESLGFVPDGSIYDEDGIDHVEMIKPAAPAN